MTTSSKMYKKIFSGLSTALLFFVVALSSFGIFFCIGNIEMMMHHDHDHSIQTHSSPCQNNFGFNECSMDLFEHIELWQNSFLSVIPSFTQIFSLLIFAAVAIFIFKQIFASFPLTSPQRFLFYSRDNPDTPLFNIFSSLFSAGILHPRLHA